VGTVGWLGAVELGGTNCRVAIGDRSNTLHEQACFPLGSEPKSSLREITQWFDGKRRPLDLVGVASFGPLDLERGAIVATPKRAWRQFPLRDELAEALGTRIVVDTDVTAAALAEWTIGAGQGFADVLYVTVGTGIGVGAVIDQRIHRGRLHPEMGHMRVPRRRGDRWPGDCDYHGDCLEGLASGHSLATRYGKPAEEISDPASWRLESEYLALGIANLSCSFRPERIVIGGGVLGHRGLLDAVRAETAELLNADYFPECAAMDSYLVSPALGEYSGLYGALLLASNASSPTGAG
jgi:fructokinase